MSLFLAINHLLEQRPPLETIQAHQAWLGQAFAQGQAMLGGSLEQGGLVLVQADSLEAAQGLLEQDPLVLGGWVRLEMSPFHPDPQSPWVNKP